MEMPPLQSERLVIRPLADEDLSAVMSVLAVSGPEAGVATARYVRHGALNAQVLAELGQPPTGDRAMLLRETGELVGLAGLVPAFGPFDQLRGDAEPEHLPPPALNRIEIGLYYHVHSGARRRGYATEAATALVHFAFERLNVARIVATTEYDNAASQAVMRHLGMQLHRNALSEPGWLQVVGLLENGDRADRLATSSTAS